MPMKDKVPFPAREGYNLESPEGVRNRKWPIQESVFPKAITLQKRLELPEIPSVRIEPFLPREN